MIKLLDEKDLFQRKDGKMDMHNHFDMIIQNKLNQGWKNKELIYTQDLRGIGKTYELIQFAKKYGLNVIVMSYMNKKILKDKYNYDKIYSQEDRDINSKDCVIDECVNIDLLKERGINILTGFSYIKNQTIKKGKIVCRECGQELDNKDFYLTDNKRFHMCKKCVDSKYKYNNLSQFIELLVNMNIPFIKDLYSRQKSIGEYLKYINLPQYKGLKFKDSVFKIFDSNYTKKNSEDSGKPISVSNSDLISVLNNEIQQLILKIDKAREQDNIGTYKNLIISLGEVIKLKDKEREKDWQPKYSEYKLNDKNGQKQVAIWEQNSDGQIRDYKVWNIERNKQIKPSINITMNIKNKDELEQSIKDLEEKMKNIKIGLTI